MTRKTENGSDTFSFNSKSRQPTAGIGEYLRKKRKAKNISFDEAANRTNIRPLVMQALENDDLSSLPADVYVRGFIKIYAEFLELDPDECLSIYKEQALERTSGSGEFDAKMVSRLKSVDDSPSSSIRPLQLIGIALIVCLAVYAGVTLFTRETPRETSLVPPAAVTGPPIMHPQPETLPAAPPPPAKPLQTDMVAAAPTATEGTSVGGEEPAPAQETAPYILSVDFVERTWLWIQIDDRRAREFSFDAGESRIWQADQSINLYLGNAGGAELTLNGRSLPMLGRSGQTKKVSIPQDYPDIPANGS